MPTYEYKFVRLGEGRGSAIFGVRARKVEAYQSVVHEHARQGWRLVQDFAPGMAIYGTAKYYELIFERELGTADTTP
ncbi:MAG TPA: DUF4177 domain-containing protein [Streptosporangiaceae bacterium]|nr:DUF4177 domain-containing protein [Streptosporangiaceae bacterium]